MSVEEDFLEWQKEACRVWMKDDQRVRRFVLETMQRMINRGELMIWDSFASTQSWDSIKATMSSEMQYRFHSIWKKCEQEVFSGE